MDALSTADYESVKRAGRVLHERGWRQVFSVNEMTDSWRQLITDLEESGYHDVVDEYQNDLSCREWLAQAWPLLTEKVRAIRQPELDALDARFLAATEEGPRLSSRIGWWWRRLPLRRSGDFARDLAGRGW